MSNPIDNIVYHWNEHKKAMDNVHAFASGMLVHYDGRNMNAIKALVSKIIHMTNNIGCPQSATDMLKRIARGKMFTYGVNRTSYSRTSKYGMVDIIKLKGIQYNKTDFEYIQRGHFRHDGKIHKLDRDDQKFINDYWFTDYKFINQALPFNIRSFRVASYEGCKAIEIKTDKGNDYRIVVYDDNTVTCNWSNHTKDKVKDWALKKLAL